MNGSLHPPHPIRDPDRLGALEAYSLRNLGSETGFDGIVMLARTLCAAPTALVSFVGAECQWFAARSGFGPVQTPLNQSVCAHTLDQSSLLIIPDLAADRRTRDNSLVTGIPHLRFYAGAPLRTRDGFALGALCVLDIKPRMAGLSGEEAEGLCTLAAQVMVQLELRRQLADMQAEIATLQA